MSKHIKLFFIQKKSQFYLFTSLLLIGIVLSYFSLPLIMDNSQIHEENFFLNIYKEGQKAYNFGFEDNDFLKEYNLLYSSNTAENIFFNLEKTNRIFVGGKQKLIFGNKGIENLVKFTSEAEAYQIPNNKKIKLIWFIKNSYIIGTEKFNVYYLILNQDLNENKDLEGTNLRIMDSNSNLFYLYDSNNIDNNKTILSETLKNQQIDIYTNCGGTTNCITQYQQEYDSLMAIKNDMVQINKFNLGKYELEYPIKIYYNNNEYIIGNKDMQYESLLFSMVGISSEIQGEKKLNELSNANIVASVFFS